MAPKIDPAAVLPAVPSRESLGEWRIGAGGGRGSDDGSASAPSSSSGPSSPRTPTPTSFAAAAPSPASPASSTPPGFKEQQDQPRPIPGPWLFRTALRLAFPPRLVESLFYDDVDADEEEEEAEEEGGSDGGEDGEDQERAAAAGGSNLPLLRLRRRGPHQNSDDDNDSTNENSNENGNENADDDNAEATTPPPAPPSTSSTSPASSAPARIRAIRDALADAAADARARYPLLRPQHQDAVGLCLLVSSACALLLLFAAHYRNLVAWPIVVPLAAFLTSILHELEHDLIHSLYFKGKKLAFFGQLLGRPIAAVDAALAACYAFRPSTIHPWARRTLHLNHHRLSGTPGDLEERSITNGARWSPLRLVATGDNLLAIALRPIQTALEMRAYIRAQPATVKADPSERVRIIIRNATGYAPLGFVHYVLWWSFCVVSVVALVSGVGSPALLFSSSLLWQQTLWPVLRFYAAVMGAPQFLRTFSLHFVSSNIHYYTDKVRTSAGGGGGKKSKKNGSGSSSSNFRGLGVIEQVQILDTPLFWPLQLFCFNFGATHALHHFAPAQPFYLRQAVSGDARVRAALKSGGVKFNDLGTFARANRLPVAEE